MSRYLLVARRTMHHPPCYHLILLSWFPGLFITLYLSCTVIFAHLSLPPLHFPPPAQLRHPVITLISSPNKILDPSYFLLCTQVSSSTPVLRVDILLTDKTFGDKLFIPHCLNGTSHVHLCNAGQSPATWEQPQTPNNPRQYTSSFYIICFPHTAKSQKYFCNK